MVLRSPIFPSDSVFFPSHPESVMGGDNDPAVVLASYTWSDDASSWTGMHEIGAIRHALDNVIRVHANEVVTEKEIRESFLGGAKHDWTADNFILGAFALFTPNQQTELYNTKYVYSAEGRLNFAGEHTTLTHAWIEGSIESARLAAFNILAQIGGVDGSIGIQSAPVKK